MSHIRIFNHYIAAPLFALGLIESVLLCASMLLGYAVGYEYRFVGTFELDLSFRILSGSGLFALVMLACTSAMGVYSAGLRDGNGAMAVRTVVAYCLLGCASLTIIYYIFPALYMGRGVLASSIVIALFLVIPFRWAYLRLIDGDSLRTRILVLGVGDKAIQFADEIGQGHAGLAKVVGFVDTGGAVAEGMPKELLFSPDAPLFEIAEKCQASEIVIALDDRRLGGQVLPLKELFDCKMKGIRVSESIAVTERELGQIVLEDIRPSWLVFSSGFYSTFIWRTVKRLFDLSVSLIILLLASPLMLLAALAIALESGFPVIYRQVRVGQDGKHFEILKFRSMTVDAESDGKAVWASQNDSRVTKVGAFIRNTRIDELPQLFNVIKGEMSIVGPRPERPQFVEQLQEALPYYSERHCAKPGLMGWAQLNYPYGASIEDARNKLRYDLYYVKNKSLLLDLIILVQTVQVILLGTGVR